MQLSVTGASMFYTTQVQVFDDYLLLWILPGLVYTLSKL
jgi:hypothetical protein